MYGKSNMEAYITICNIDSRWEFAVWLRKLKQGLCINLEEWDGEADGREFQKGGDICISMANTPGGGHGNPLQYSCLENIHGKRSLVGYSPWVAKSWA